jgi:hypothetical protein
MPGQPGVQAPPVTWTDAPIVDRPVEQQQAEQTGNGSNGSSNSGSARGGGAMGAFAAMGGSRGNKDAGEQFIPVLDKATENSFRLTIVYVKCCACEKTLAFEQNVLRSVEVATELQGCACISVDADKVTRELRKAYDLPGGSPGIAAYDVNGKRLFAVTGNTTAAALARLIKSAKEHVAKQIAKANG